MENHATNVFAEQRKSKLEIADQQCIPAERKSGGYGLRCARSGRRADVARSGLIFGKSAMGNISAAKESLGQRDRVGRGQPRGSVERFDHAERYLSREDDVACNAMIC